jgi:hypothetical protein
MNYNFVRIHQTLRSTPDAGLLDRPWDMADMMPVVEEWEANQKVGQ